MATVINVFCNAGMSTSALVKKIQDHVASKGLDITINAFPFIELDSKAKEANFVLLGPQIGYEHKKVKAKLDPLGIPSGVIPMADYGRMNAENVLNFALGLKV
ncbi:MAG: PTS sugar transporter subunit IIB [Spirochaetaceae bacterium]|jgi:PTS system cellobiose-specific IIB component|nr:PTS sugar transporter subunit IIB [Spirochaetaceae bacterium]